MKNAHTPPLNHSNTPFHKWLFFSMLAGYSLAYAPFGINETDGGFITGLAWQLLSGKQLFTEIIYIRPPLLIWLRAAELLILPENWAILAERVLFYWKIGFYSLLAADILRDKSSRSEAKWPLATLGFLVSAHCFPAAAWHTIDGILMAVIALWLLLKNSRKSLIFSSLAGVFTIASMLCKQSFYPFSVVFFALLFLEKSRREIVAAAVGFFSAAGLFFSWLIQKNVWSAYFFWTSGAGSASDIFQHGLLDFFRIQPKPLVVALGFAAMGRLVGFVLKVKKRATAWFGFLVGLAISFIMQVIENQDFTAPFAQSRLLFLAAVGLIFFDIFKTKSWKNSLPLAAFLSISWMAAISWGYNLPVLFATPLVFAAMEIGRRLAAENAPRTAFFAKIGSLLPIFGLILTFRVGYEFIYRDGRRSEMTEPLSPIFPKLSGIFTDSTSLRRYADLRFLHEKWGRVAVVPSFPLADFLLDQRPALPLDWESQWETLGHNSLIFNALSQPDLTILVEKTYGERLRTEPKLSVAAWVFEHQKLVDETPDFFIFQNK